MPGRFMHKNLLILVSSILVLSGCVAPGPTISELRKDIKSTTFVQYGNAPLKMSFGVVDTASFWAANGGHVASQMGGGALWHYLEADGHAKGAQRAPEAAKVMRFLYNDHPMANQAMTAVMPEFAHAWGVPYDPKQLRVLDANKPFEDAQGYLVGFESTADLVLAVWVNSLQLTEKITMGAAFAAGFTFGTSTKDVTAESYLWLRAYRREAGTGRYKQVWVDGCRVANMDMKTSYPFPELIASREKAKEIWDEATPKLIENCKTLLQIRAKQTPA
jgi:hypothetical protein